MRPDEIIAIRAKLKLSQPKFAALLGVPTGTLMNWEQGRRAPHGSALMLLRVASRRPDVLEVAQEPAPAEQPLQDHEMFTGSDRACQAVRECKKIGAELHQVSEKQRVLLEQLHDEIIVLIQAADMSELHGLGMRITRLHELRRTAEYGSFMIGVDRVMEKVWQSL